MNSKNDKKRRLVKKKYDVKKSWQIFWSAKNISHLVKMWSLIAKIFFTDKLSEKMVGICGGKEKRKKNGKLRP